MHKSGTYRAILEASVFGQQYLKPNHDNVILAVEPAPEDYTLSFPARRSTYVLKEELHKMER